MKNMSEGMQAVAGKRLRKMISAVTDNRLMACGTGAAVTSLIQSSSITTVMLVGFVNAGVMTLRQAIGVILGADIGTTVTAWIVSLNIIEYGLPMLGISGLFFLFTKNERVRYVAMTIMGVGMVFFGMQLMKHGLEPIRHSEGVTTLLSRFEPKDYGGVIRCAVVGALVTAVVQSSSATVAITITLAQTDVIGFDTAVALVLGENIGTTITAYLASLGTTTNAKRVAYAHILIKVIAVSIMLSVFFLYMRLLNTILDDGLDIAKRIAFSHTLFNLLLVCVFLPFVGILAAALSRIVPDKPHEEAPHLTFLDIRMVDTPAFGIQQSLDEVRRMGEGACKMLDWLKATIADEERDAERERKIFHREKVLDTMQREIVEFLGGLMAGTLPHDVVQEARRQLRVADEYESISDYVVNILKLNLKMRNSGLRIGKEETQSLLNLHDHVSGYIGMIAEAVRDNNPDVLSKAATQGKTITHVMKDARQAHLTRVEQQHVSPLLCLTYVDMLSCYRKIKDHALNIAEAVAGEK